MVAGLDIVAGSLGVIGVAQQLAASIFKIKDFCKDVKNAPEELLDTIRSMENISKILMRLDEGRTRDRSETKDGSVFQECLRISKLAADRVATLTMDLQLDVQCRRGLGAVKTVLKQREIKLMLEKLDRSRIDLQFAYTMYTDACRRHEYEAIKYHMNEERNERMQILVAAAVVSQLQDNANDDDKDSTAQLGRTSSDPASQAAKWAHTTRIHLPIWLCRYVWDLAFAHACGQWTVALKTFKILELGHDAYGMIMKDDVGGIRDLLERRQLSIHDEFSSGHSLLSVAIKRGSLAIVRLLVDSGVPADCSHATLWWCVLHASSRHDVGFADFVKRIAQLLLKTMQGDIPSRLEAMDKTPSCWTDEDRLQLLDCVVQNGEVARTRNFFDILGKEKVAGSVYNSNTASHINALHLLARNCQVILGEPALRDQWLYAVERNASDVSGLHAKYDNGLEHQQKRYTAFGFLLWELVLKLYWKDRERLDVIQLWARCLAQAGVDLLIYGGVEKKFLCKHPKLGSELRNLGGFLSFSYGPKPTDWYLWFQHPGDVYAGIFWDLVEQRRQYLPGSWIEEDCVPEYEQQRFELSTRDIGVKRKVLRRLRAKAKWKDPFDVGSTGQVEELWQAVDSNARACVEGRFSSNEARESRGRMLDLAIILGITTEEFRRNWSGAATTK